ncbi:endonuclease/exonuclease/phosphatase family protein [Georgenia sp. AZ-5]|uniref:endonuclease/exonuclease/phosphatase family protein n=1 Tax=Georgenia sp. AZ-5 TaxID=3367526 RepID=UPI00375435CE
MRVIGWLLALVLAAAAVLTLNPEWLARARPDWAGVTMTYPVSQLIALRPLLAGVFLILALVLLVVGVVRRRWFRRGVKSFVLAVVCAVVALGHAAIVVERGLDNQGRLAADDGVGPDGEGTGEITVLALNTAEGDTTPEQVAELAADNGADVLVLPETPRLLAERVAGLLAADGAEFQLFVAGATGGPAVGATAVLVSAALGPYIETPPPDTVLGAVRAEPADGDGPVILGVHPVAPVARRTQDWQADLEAVTALCRDGAVPGLVVAGDLNATLDHRPLQDLGACADAAVATGVGGVSTWPAALPAWFGSTIDHVLHDASAYVVTDGAVLERGGSDHRAVVVRLRPAG